MGRLLAQEKGSNWGLLGSERVYLAINPIGAAPSLYTKIDRKGGGGGEGGVSALIVLYCGYWGVRPFFYTYKIYWSRDVSTLKTFPGFRSKNRRVNNY